MKKKIDCKKYNIFNLHKKNEQFNFHTQYKILFKILENKEIYENKDLKVLKYIEKKGLIENKKLTLKGKCYILSVAEMKFGQKFYLLAMAIIFLPIILPIFFSKYLKIIGNYVPINGNYVFYFYLFMITFGMYFLMKRNSKNREEYIENFKNKYFNQY